MDLRTTPPEAVPKWDINMKTTCFPETKRASSAALPPAQTGRIGFTSLPDEILLEIKKALQWEEAPFNGESMGKEGSATQETEEEEDDREKEAEEGLITLLCLALTCKRFWTVFGSYETVRKVRGLYYPSSFAPKPKRPNRSIIWESKWWGLLKRLEDSRWRCCSGCLVLHPEAEFSKSELQVEAERRVCVFGPLVGVIDLCPCFRMTFRMKNKLVKEMLLPPEPSEDILAGSEVSVEIHECSAERWMDGSTRANRLHRCSWRKYSELFAHDRTEKNYEHTSAFWIPELGGRQDQDPEHRFRDPNRGFCYACDCEDGMRFDKRFCAVINADGDLSIVTEMSVETFDHPKEDYEARWTPVYSQLEKHPIFICPHRSLQYLTLDLYATLFHREGYEHSTHQVVQETATKPVLPLLRCDYCDTRVVELTTGRGFLSGPQRVFVRTIRGLGKASLDRPDEKWFAQTAFSSEGLDEEEQKKRNPWKSWYSKIKHLLK